MYELLNWVWQGCVVALAAALALRLLDRARARHRYLLCWAAMLAVLALPVASAVGPPFSFPPLPPGAPAPAAALIAVPDAWWTSSILLLAVWGVWVAASGVRLGAAVLAARRAARRCRPFPPAVESKLRCWNQVRTGGRPTRLALGRGVRSAAVLGWGRPIIAVAPPLLRRLQPDELDRLVVHEWSHVQRRDDLLNIAHFAVRAVAGWHPAVWWLERQLRLERELACDEAAVSFTGCPKRYAASLAAAAGLLRTPRPALAALDAVPPTGLRARVVRILAHRRLAAPRRSAGAVAAAILTLIVLSGAVAELRMIGPGRTPETVAPAGELRTPVGESSNDAPQAAPPPASRGAVAEPPRPPVGSSTVRARPLDEGRAGGQTPQASDSGLPAGGAAQAMDLLPGRAASTPSPSRAPGLQRSRPASPEARPASPWDAAAGTGAAVGRGTRDAAVRTAGFFTRFGRKVAGSF